MREAMAPRLIRNAVDARLMTDLQRAVEARFASAEGDERDWINLHGLVGAKLPELPQALDALAPVKAWAEEYLGGPAVIAIDHMLFRQRLPNEQWTGHNFHQDYNLIPKLFPLNMWLPLTPITPECAGLSFVLPSPPTALDLPIDIESYMEGAGAKVWTPELEPGDLIVFNHLTIHGGFFAAKPVPRYSLEFRLGRQDGLADYAGPTQAL